ncbi:uncharacterized protein V1518DRAFT_135718 [Limtongia smithiae]|uniref:uncharacterized protein n=1 Tax=Limtongia smithiae TaxID=1125753 RepID=UPI0034CE2C99
MALYAGAYDESSIRFVETTTQERMRPRLQTEYVWRRRQQSNDTTHRIMSFIQSLPTPPSSPQPDEGGVLARRQLDGCGYDAIQDIRRRAIYFDILDDRDHDYDTIFGTDNDDLSHHAASSVYYNMRLPQPPNTVRHVPHVLSEVQIHAVPARLAVPPRLRKRAQENAEKVSEEVREAIAQPEELSGLGIAMFPEGYFSFPASAVRDTITVVPREDERAIGPHDHVRQEEMLCTVRLCSETSSLRADEEASHKLTGLPPALSRFSCIFRNPQQQQKQLEVPPTDTPAMSQSETGRKRISAMLKKRVASDSSASSSSTTVRPDEKKHTSTRKFLSASLCSFTHTSHYSDDFISHGPITTISREDCTTLSPPALVQTQAREIQEINELDTEKIAEMYKTYVAERRRQMRRASKRSQQSGTSISEGLRRLVAA